ncbi:chromosome partitioning protein, ParB family [Pseudobutyrivibrio sp. YE44]|uniref:ParB/RepB/Spo0J family partition protein n=1 Tax=Pseudobutyrivibrio sp. YE44 TaxID=1520802 RepID=UPI0008879015|nr:ParB/RepB/Spo0J family partition protein [Pseudobutyrivibrio sp. YE44]SDB52385.1 chromosome partitioning protein, ParB family [Pseudobutyrivibrio sp. YE44]
MAKKGGLGKGLDSLIVKKEEGVVLANPEEHGSPVEVDINKIEPNKLQPRKNFDEDKLQELSENIKIHGIVNPLIVQDRGSYYEIIGGERRWRAARLAGFKKVPVIIKKLSEQEFVEISLIDNIQREQLNPIEEAMAFARLIDEFKLKQDEVAERVSKSRTTITNALRLLKLDRRVQDMIIDDKLSTGHARAMLAITDSEKQYEFAERAFDEKMSVRDVEREVKKLLNDKQGDKKAKAAGLDPQLVAIYQDTQEKLKSVLGTKVFINAKDNKTGKLEIEYYSQDELNRIVDLLESIK